MWKRGEIAPQEQFLLFSTLLYIYISSFRSHLHIHLLNVVAQFIVFLALSTLICRGTDISKCFSKSLGIRDKESRLYITPVYILSNYHKIRGMFEMNCLLSSSSISTWDTIKTNTYLYRAIQYLHNGV